MGGQRGNTGTRRSTSISTDHLFFDDLTAVVLSLFDNLTTADYMLRWRDEDGDLITIKTDQDSAEALLASLTTATPTLHLVATLCESNPPRRASQMTDSCMADIEAGLAQCANIEAITRTNVQQQSSSEVCHETPDAPNAPVQHNSQQQPDEPQTDEPQTEASAGLFEWAFRNILWAAETPAPPIAGSQQSSDQPESADTATDEVAGTD